MRGVIPQGSARAERRRHEHEMNATASDPDSDHRPPSWPITAVINGGQTAALPEGRDCSSAVHLS